MSDWIIPKFSLQAESVFKSLSRERQRELVYLAQILARLVEQAKTELIDNRRNPPEHKFRWRGFSIKFHILPQSNIPVFLEIIVH